MANHTILGKIRDNTRITILLNGGKERSPRETMLASGQVSIWLHLRKLRAKVDFSTMERVAETQPKGQLSLNSKERQRCKRSSQWSSLTTSSNNICKIKIRGLPLRRTNHRAQKTRNVRFTGLDRRRWARREEQSRRQVRNNTCTINLIRWSKRGKLEVFWREVQCQQTANSTIST